jgi:REP element-mobilizing transposase RayT
MSWNDLRKGRFSQPNEEYFITFNTHNRLDIFTDFRIAQLFCQQIAINESKHQCKWLTWVLMPDHFHGLLRLGEEETLLSKVIAELKGSTAYIINTELDRKGKLWQTSFYDHALRKEEGRENIARYIIANPLRKELVKNIRNYPYWDSVYL